MRIIIERLTQQRLDAERQSTVLSSETKRMGEDKRMEEAKVQGIRARLAEAEAEVMVLRREREEVREKKKKQGRSLKPVSRTVIVWGFCWGGAPTRKTRCRFQKLFSPDPVLSTTLQHSKCVPKTLSPLT